MNKFMDIQGNKKKSKFYILPVEYDVGSSFRTGTDNGPMHIIAASKGLNKYDIETDSIPVIHGIYTEKPII